MLLWIEYEARFGLITLLIGVFYSGVGVAVLNRSGAPREVARYAMYTALIFGTLAAALQFTGVWITIAYSIGLIAIGVFRRSRTLRLAGIGLILLPIVKLFGFDVFLLVRGYRVAAFVSLGVMLLALGLAYQRYSEAFRGFFTAEQGSRLVDSDPKASVSKDEDKEKGERDE